MRTELGSGARSMARGATLNFAGAVTANVAAFAFTYLLTQVVSPAEIGRLAIATTLVGLAAVPAVLGLDTGAIRFVALAAGEGDERAARASVQVSLAVVTVSGTALAALLVTHSHWAAQELFHQPSAGELVRIVGFSLPAVALVRVVIACLQGYGAMRYSAWLNVLQNGGVLIVAGPLLAAGFGIDAVAVAWVVAAYASLGLGLLLLVRLHPRVLVPAGRWDVGTIMRFSIPQTLSGMLFYFIIWTDTLLLARLGTATQVGIYNVAGRLLLPATFITTAVQQMFAPRVAAEGARGNPGVVATMLKRVTHWSTAVSLPLFLCLALVPGPLLGLFGNSYERGATALAVLAVGQLINTGAGPTGLVINMSGRPYINLANNLLVAALNVGACLVLIPRYGMAGAAASTAMALTLVNLLKLVEVRLLYGIHPFRPDTPRILTSAAAALAVAAPLAFVPSWASTFAEVAVVVPTLILSYVVASRALGVDDEDRELLVAGRARLGRALRVGRLLGHS